jgi:cell division protein ZapA (FtsZ GTPase activity inhibitor)
MPKINNQHRKAQFALALAAGSTAIAWAKENNVPESTIYRWANSDEVEEAVDRIRREVWQQTIARLSQKATGAADQIAKLAEEAASESVRLSASRAVLADLMAVTDYAALERRLAKIERRLREQDRASVIDAEPEPGSTGPATDDHSPRRRKRACPA